MSKEESLGVFHRRAGLGESIVNQLANHEHFELRLDEHYEALIAYRSALAVAIENEKTAHRKMMDELGRQVSMFESHAKLPMLKWVKSKLKKGTKTLRRGIGTIRLRKLPTRLEIRDRSALEFSARNEGHWPRISKSTVTIKGAPESLIAELREMEADGIIPAGSMTVSSEISKSKLKDLLKKEGWVPDGVDVLDSQERLYLEEVTDESLGEAEMADDQEAVRVSGGGSNAARTSHSQAQPEGRHSSSGGGEGQAVPLLDPSVVEVLVERDGEP